MGSIHFPNPNPAYGERYTFNNQTWVYDGMSWNGQDLGNLGADPYWSNVVLLLGNDNKANGSTTFMDQSSAGRNATVYSGNPVYSTVHFPTGMSSSLYSPGGNSVLQVGNGSWIQFGSNNFCAETYFYDPSSQYSDLMSTVVSSGYDEFQMLVYPNNITFLGSLTAANWDISGSTGTFSFATWNHAAIYRIGSNFYAAINGVVTNVGTNAGSLYATTNPLLIGSAGTFGQVFTGYMCGVRITNGNSRYGSSNFTIPTLPLPNHG